MKIRIRDRKRYIYLLTEKERLKGFFMGNDELIFLRDKYNFNKRGILN